MDQYTFVLWVLVIMVAGGVLEEIIKAFAARSRRNPRG